MLAALPVLAALAISSLLACRAGESPPLTPQIQLVERLAFARSRALDGSPAAPPAQSEGGTLVQRAGSGIRFGFAVPRHARLVASFALDPSTGGDGPAVVQISLLEAPDRETLLHEASVANAADAATNAVEIDLSAWSGRLVNLDLRFRSAAGSRTLRWDRLRVDGASAPTATAATIRRDAYNVLVVVLDSLRADHLTPYGALDIATPMLAELASKGVVFEAARSNASWTRPSVVTMFSSRYPWSHGVLEPDSVFPDALPYLPELLSEAGYASEGASANDMVSALFGMSRGFSNLYSLRKSPIYRKLRDPFERARFVFRQLLDKLASQDTPFFAYLHQLDPHSPYKPPPKYRRRFVQTSGGNALAASVENIRHLRRRAGDLSERQIDHLGRLYKGEVAFMDDYVGELIRQLEARGLAKNTLIVFTSDHGEEFFEHRSLGHGHTVYDELLRVPLILRLDGVLPAGRRVTQPVELIDLAPTVLDLLGLEVPPAMQGRSLLAYIEDPSAAPRPISLAVSGQPWRYAIGHGRWKLIRSDAAKAAAAAGVQLFDLELDPGELRDLSAEQPVVVTALRQLLAWNLARESLAERAPVPRARLDPETLEALRAIGYLDPTPAAP